MNPALGSWLRRVAHDGGTVGDIADDDGPGADNGPSADRDPGHHRRADAEERFIADADDAGEGHARAKLDAFAKDAIVVDVAVGVDDAERADDGVRRDDGTREDDGAFADGSVRRYRGRGMDNTGHCTPGLLYLGGQGAAFGRREAEYEGDARAKVLSPADGRAEDRLAENERARRGIIEDPDDAVAAGLHSIEHVAALSTPPLDQDVGAGGIGHSGDAEVEDAIDNPGIDLFAEALPGATNAKGQPTR